MKDVRKQPYIINYFAEEYLSLIPAKHIYMAAQMPMHLDEPEYSVDI